MIFQQLILQNFGLYRGRQSIDLAPGNATQPIILIGGLNGRGKTTLLDAIRLALYGHRAPCSNRGTLAYADFLTQSAHRHTLGQETAIHLIFHHTLNSQLTEFRLCRTWTAPLKSGKDTLQVYLNGTLSPDWTDAWDERIESLFPLGISNLFLFDGEQVKDLAEQDDLPPTVIQAMRSLLGLKLPDRLSADLEVLQRRKQKEVAGTQHLQQLETLETHLKTLEAEKRTALQEEAALRPKLERAENQLRQAEDRFLAEGGKIAAEKHQLELRLDTLRIQADQHRDQLRTLAASALPLALIQGLLKDAQTQVEQELEQEQQAIAHTLLHTHTENLLEFLQTLKLTQAQYKKIQTYLKKTLSGQEIECRRQEAEGRGYEAEGRRQEAQSLPIHSSTHPPIHSSTPQTLATLTQTLAQIPHLQQQAQAITHQLQQTLAKIDGTERYLSTAAAPEAYEKLQQAVRTAQAEVAQLKTAFTRAEHQHQQVKQSLEQTRKALLSFSQLAIDFKNTEHILKSITTVQDTLVEFKKRLKNRKLHRLETLVTECFHHLVHKVNLVHQIQIHPDTFALQLFDADGEPLPKSRLSAGEKQLLAIALLWGLARASGRQLPVAIDTPLGRLDSHHRHNLVERYFPQASHQVILFSTDTEIQENEVMELRKAGAICREYLLHYDVQQRQTHVKFGYFW